jgi:hypothetical protein
MGLNDEALGRLSDRIVRVMRRLRRESSTTTPEDGNDRPPIFLSFRREDTSFFATRLYEALRIQTPHEPLPPGFDYLVDPVDWVGELIEKGRGSTIVLVLIGPKWLDILTERNTSDGGFSDPVHIELLAALRHRVPLLAVLVDGASLPTASSLPLALSQLADIPSVPFRHSSWQEDFDSLVEAIERYRRT